MTTPGYSSSLTSFRIYKSKWSISYWWQEQEQEQECRFEQMSTMRLIEHVHAGHNYWDPAPRHCDTVRTADDGSVFNIPPHWNVLISTPSLLLMLPCRITTYLGRQYRQASSLTSQTWKLQQMCANGSMTRTTSSRDDTQVIRGFL